jgi:hypothetical protein
MLDPRLISAATRSLGHDKEAFSPVIAQAARNTFSGIRNWAAPVGTNISQAAQKASQNVAQRASGFDWSGLANNARSAMQTGQQAFTTAVQGQNKGLFGGARSAARAVGDHLGVSGHVDTARQTLKRYAPYAGAVAGTAYGLSHLPRMGAEVGNQQRQIQNAYRQGQE